MRSSLRVWPFLQKAFLVLKTQSIPAKETACIASYFTTQENENISPGDLVAVDKSGQRVYRPQEYGDLHVIGAAVSKAALVLNPPQGVLARIRYKRQGTLYSTSAVWSGLNCCRGYC